MQKFPQERINIMNGTYLPVSYKIATAYQNGEACDFKNSCPLIYAGCRCVVACGYNCVIGMDVYCQCQKCGKMGGEITLPNGKVLCRECIKPFLI